MTRVRGVANASHTSSPAPAAEYGTYKTVKATLWPGIPGEGILNLLHRSLLVSAVRRRDLIGTRVRGVENASRTSSPALAAPAATACQGCRVGWGLGWVRLHDYTTE